MNKHTWADGPEQWRQGTQKPVGGWCGRLDIHTAHEDCTGVEAIPYSSAVRSVSPEPDVRNLMRDAVGRPIGEVFALHSTQEALDGLAEQVADMLDNALHLEACWISGDETRCVCLIAALRAALPRCGHVENIGVKGLTRQCLSTVHPSAAYRHVFGTV